MASVVKIKRSSVQGKAPTNSDITAGELALNTRDGKLFSSDGSVVFEIGANTTNLNVTNDMTVGNDLTVSNDIYVTNDIIPTSNNGSNIGTATKRFGELYLAGQTINLGGATISSDGSGTLSISAQGAVLPAGSKVEVGAAQKQLATLDDDGTAPFSVSLFTQATGLSTAANTFTFRVNTDKKLFTAFTLEDGTVLADDTITQFLF